MRVTQGQNTKTQAPSRPKHENTKHGGAESDQNTKTQNTEVLALVYVDNSGAVELSRDRKSCHRSRHVDRRFFKVRELSYEGVLRVEHIDTKLNSSDLLTKPLPWALFEAHRRRLFNM